MTHPSGLSRWHTTLNQFLRFGVVGLFGFAIDTAFLYLGIYAFDLSRVWAGLFSFPFAVSFTWIGNRLFTFRDAVHAPPAQQLVKFAIVCAVGLFFNRGTYIVLVSHMDLVYQNPVLGLLAGTGAGMFFNFFASRRHVFGL